MGAHTAVAYALAHPERLAGLVVIGPVYMGSVDEEALAYWDRLADGLERGGVDGFMEAYDRGLDPAWRDTVLRFTRERMLRHRHPEAVAGRCARCRARRPSRRSAELEFSTLPALVVASHDEADPGHPYAVAAAYAERLPRGPAGQRGRGGVAAGLAGRQALARDRLVLRRACRRREAPPSAAIGRSPAPRMLRRR